MYIGQREHNREHYVNYIGYIITRDMKNYYQKFDVINGYFCPQLFVWSII